MHAQALNGSADLWFYGGAQERVSRVEQFSAPGQPSVDQGNAATPATFTHTVVSYRSKTWFMSTGKVDLIRRQPGAQTSCATATGLIFFMQDPATLTADIREALSCAELTKEGTVPVDGVSAIRLVSVLSSPQVGGATFVRTTTLLVNPATYLPMGWLVSTTVTHPGGQASHAELSYAISWLPSTRANLASLRVPIPAGFTRVSPKAQS